MIKFISFLISCSLVLIITSCTEVVYDNPIDPNGINADLIKSDPSSLEDEDNNGIINIADPKWSKRPLDVTPPKITLKGGDTVYIPYGDPQGKLSLYTDVKNTNFISVKDSADPNPDIISNNENVNIFKINDAANPYYRIIYTATDSSRNASTATRFVVIYELATKDTMPPVLIFDDTTWLSVGDFFDNNINDSAYDKEERRNVHVTVTGTVNTSQTGVYTLNYSVTDTSGNKATGVRIIIVEKIGDSDNIAPVITLTGQTEYTLQKDQTIDQFKAAWIEPGYSATDDQNGITVNLTASVVISDFIYVPPAYYRITYNVKDSSGNNAAEVQRIVKTGNGDLPFPPTITLDNDSTVIIKIGGKWKEPGFNVFDEKDKTLTKESVVVDSSDVVNNLKSGTTGTFYVKYSVKNSLGLEGTATRTVSIVKTTNDRIKPVITILGRNPDTVLLKSASYVDPGCTAFDDPDGDLTSKITSTGKPDLNRLGSYSISYTVTDAAGNKSVSTIRTVWVVPDTLTTDLGVRYNVPSPDPLPNINNVTYTVFNTDGNGPDLSTTILKSVNLTWQHNENNDQFQFSMQYTAAPHHTDLNSTVHNFVTQPQMTLKNTSIEGLDGKYYVTLKKDGTLVWVRQDLSFAILLTKGSIK